MNRRVAAKATVGVMAACLLTVACTNQTPVSGVDDAWTALNGSWGLIAWSNPAALPTRPITLDIAGEQIGGESACNHYQGVVAAHNGQLNVGTLGTTYMLCLDTQAAENTYLQLLQGATEWFKQDDYLVLGQAGNETLRYKPNP